MRSGERGDSNDDGSPRLQGHGVLHRAVHPCDARGHQLSDDRGALRVTASARCPTRARVSNLACFSFAQRFRCDATITAVAPLEIIWTVDGTIVPAFGDQTSMTGRCTAGHIVDVQVWVRDASGYGAQRSEGVQCY
jgi:hypothetical protein